MASDLRLRQICLVAPQLEAVVEDLAAILGLAVCYRDPHVGHYGLANALMPIDTVLLEVVAPVTAGTAAGRFLDKTHGRGGYMAIFSCADPAARRAHAERLGVRVAHVIDRPPYLGVQLHPRDCRAAFIEFNHTNGGEDPRGPYPPAGPYWHTFIDTATTRRLVQVDFASPQPADLARHWGAILDLPVGETGAGASMIDVAPARLCFQTGPVECLSGLTVEVADSAAIARTALARGHAVAGHSLEIGGITLSWRAAAESEAS
ncbi:VOC family protein [Bradyrhizobium sp. U87765 SZCCT0131]|uniref:VOC family protein n=1 Tax=unclassified Bradyrhizobium TaxID=2631580 RepID=UPI001BA4D43D|nr:VOC family protein [Bradyrhizobium sp. U87765 SZCCT0131]MBR1259090.1 VOC family protein [Bradyrhizobium sp. U87765 SZCCT0134]MBR1305231.1 VOC family protein [Bradyrhizobium sp. U87765 SZCCT0110]MBR1321017.1 VOC family protein [Bradyrhizobium sp. U87765 SZCCT0109]MBR1350329.1 VOC family protein [Bradyrhizobium sp. U87765 SZCCT0048]